MKYKEFGITTSLDSEDAGEGEARDLDDSEESSLLVGAKDKSSELDSSESPSSIAARSKSASFSRITLAKMSSKTVAFNKGLHVIDEVSGEGHDWGQNQDGKSRCLLANDNEFLLEAFSETLARFFDAVDTAVNG